MRIPTVRQVCEVAAIGFLTFVRLLAGGAFVLVAVWFIRDVGLVALFKAFHHPAFEQVRWYELQAPALWLGFGVIALAGVKVASSILGTRLIDRRFPVMTWRALLVNGFGL